MGIHSIQYELEGVDAFEDAAQLFDTPAGRMLAWGSSAPSDGDAGHAPGGLFINTGGGAGAQLLVNENTKASASWAGVEAVGGVAAAADRSIALATSETIKYGTTKLTTVFTTGLTAGGNLDTIPDSPDPSAQVRFGDGTTDADMVVFMGSTSEYAIFDVGNSRLELFGVPLHIGAFSGSTQGSGIDLSTMTAAFRVYADDGGNAIGSGSFVRAIVGRNLQTYTTGNREQESGGVVGQVVSVAGTNRHNMAGTWGSYEARTSLTVDGQAAATDTWIQAGVLGRVGMSTGTLTIATNGVLAGVAAMSNINTATTFNNSGVYAAFYAGAWANADDWAYGMYLEGGKFTTGIVMGVCTTGISIVGSTTAGISITGGTTTANAIIIGEDGTDSGNFIIYGDGSGSYMQYDADANTSTGRLNLILSTLRTSENRSLNEAAAAIRMYHDTSAANSSARSIIGECYLNASVEMTGSSHSEMNGTNGQVILQANSVLNGSGLSISGAKGEIRGSGTQTEVDHIACVLAKYNNAVNLGTGDSCLFMGWSHSGVVDYGLLLKLDAAGSVTTGIGIPACTTGIAFTGTITTGIDFTAATIAPASARTNSAIAIGDRAGAKTVTMASGAANKFLDLVQFNILIAGANPDSGSTVNNMYQLITHSTAMENIRLKCADWNIAVSANLKDAYVYQGQMDFSSSGVTVGGEAAVMGLVMNAGASAVSGLLRGLIISMEGAGFPAAGIGLEIRSTATTLAEGIRIKSTPLITVGIVMCDPVSDNCGPTHAFQFPTGSGVYGADIGPLVNTVDNGDGEGSIKIKVGSATKYLKYWADAAA